MERADDDAERHVAVARDAPEAARPLLSRHRLGAMAKWLALLVAGLIAFAAGSCAARSTRGGADDSWQRR